MMPIKIEIDLAEFYSEFESLAEWAKTCIKEDIKRAIRKSPRWKDFIQDQADQAVSAAIAKVENNDGE